MCWRLGEPESPKGEHALELRYVDFSNGWWSSKKKAQFRWLEKKLFWASECSLSYVERRNAGFFARAIFLEPNASLRRLRKTEQGGHPHKQTNQLTTLPCRACARTGNQLTTLPCRACARTGNKQTDKQVLQEHIPVRHALILSSYSVASLVLSNLLKGR